MPAAMRALFFKQLLSLRNSFDSFLCGENQNIPGYCSLVPLWLIIREKKSVVSAGNKTKTTKLLSKYASET
jgi:hypothetical protein